MPKENHVHCTFEYERTMNVILKPFGIDNPGGVDMPLKSIRLDKAMEIFRLLVNLCLVCLFCFLNISTFVGI